jgi:putative NIF3 family GTP cyclohydrolase 1 type 2
LLRLAQKGISVYSPHTAVDAAPDGLNDWLSNLITKGRYDNKHNHPLLLSQTSLIKPIKDAPPGFEGAGYGRILRFESPQTLGSIISRITLYLGLTGISVAVPQSTQAGKKSEIKITSIGICVGSGGSLLNGLDVDLLLTGELSHHEALAAIEQGKCVITTFHSNSERGYLRHVMVEKLYNALKEERRTYTYAVEVAVSAVDRDPYEIINKETLVGW